jgi:hypothetical protein
MKTTFTWALALSLTLTACGQAASTPSSPTSAAAAAVGGGEREVAGVSPRILLADAPGLRLLDASTGETVATHESSSFLRLSDAGDGRHVMVADGDQFVVYDMGIELHPHGDHDHAFTYNPGLTDVSYPAEHAGHVTVHSDTTVLFGDGDGSITMVPTDQIAEPGDSVTRTQTEAPHHGVAVWLGGAGLLTTHGTEEERHSVRLLRGEEVVAEATNCPGVHGEAAAAPIDDSPVVLFGCEDGPIVYHDGAFTKVAVADAYARTGNASGSPVSHVVLTDYKVDKNAEPERPTRVALVNTELATLTLVELGSSYWFRSLGRGPQGEALVLTYDGKLTVIDPVSGAITNRIDAITPWQEKQDWQQPGPILKVAEDMAYVTDAEKSELVIIDLTSGVVTQRFPLSSPATEMAVVTGAAGEEHAGHHH